MASIRYMWSELPVFRVSLFTLPVTATVSDFWLFLLRNIQIFPMSEMLSYLPHMARFSLKKPNKILCRKTVNAILKTGIIVVSVNEHCSEETDLICNFVVAPSHVLVNSTWFAMLHFKFLLSLRYFFASTDIHICSAVLSITHVSILHLFFVVIIYKFIEGHNISLPRCAPLLLGIISFSVISSVCN